MVAVPGYGEPTTSLYVAPPHVTSGFAELGITVSVRDVLWHGGQARESAPPVVGEERRRALVAECASPWASLSWATLGGGVSREQRYICAEVRNADLPLGVEPRAVIARFLRELDCESGVVALTSANIAQYRAAFVSDGVVSAAVLVTAGLANALRVGEPSSGPPRRYLPDTINLACWVNVPLTIEAQLEALSIVTQARTLEVLEAKVPSLEQNGWATGTGTDCIALLSTDTCAAERVASYAGMHTTVGRVLGRATREAVADVVSAWVAKARADAKLPR